MPRLKEGASLPSDLSRKVSSAPDDAAKAKSLINFLMQDRFFLALYRSTDPKVRAAAIDKLNKAHHQAYGDAPAKDGDKSRPANQK